MEGECRVSGSVQCRVAGDTFDPVDVEDLASGQGNQGWARGAGDFPGGCNTLPTSGLSLCITRTMCRGAGRSVWLLAQDSWLADSHASTQAGSG
jgi:hypothetical protein